jgi:uncharacterized protein YigE (DUF2233 family)
MRWASLLFLMLPTACSAPSTNSIADDACRDVDFEGDQFTICAARADRHAILLVDRDQNGRPIRDFAPLAPQTGKVAFAMNAGMFDQSGLPIGLYVERGRMLKQLNRADGPGNFHMKPNGVFYGDRLGWHVVTSDAWAAAPARARFATQSGPMLVVDGKLNPAFDVDGTSRYRRNGVGVSAYGTAWFAISRHPVSFGRFARLFRDALKCRQALFLDGYVSRLWYPAAERMDAGPQIGPIVVVLDKR